MSSTLQPDNDPLNDGPTAESMLRLLFGSVLLIGGIGIFGWVFVQVFDILGGNQHIPLLKTLPGIEEGMSIQTPGGPIEIPADAFVLSAYLVVLLIFSVIVNIGSATLRAGSHLLQPEIQRTLKQILRRVKRLAD